MEEVKHSNTGAEQKLCARFIFLKYLAGEDLLYYLYDRFNSKVIRKVA